MYKSNKFKRQVNKLERVFIPGFAFPGSLGSEPPKCTQRNQNPKRSDSQEELGKASENRPFCEENFFTT
eukprot:478309-Amphidinium_carterae.1